MCPMYSLYSRNRDTICFDKNTGNNKIFILLQIGNLQEHYRFVLQNTSHNVNINEAMSHEEQVIHSKNMSFCFQRSFIDFLDYLLIFSNLAFSSLKK